MKTGTRRRTLDAFVVGSVALLLAAGLASPATAAVQKCTWYFDWVTGGSRAYNPGGEGDGKCNLVQARTYYYYGAGQYGWVTGSQSSTSSSATNSSYNSIEDREGRARPVNTFGPWGSHSDGVWVYTSVST